jgi:plasmid stabilization system protein ParE
MKRYAVIIEESAQTNIQHSYDWGCRVGGETQAQKWVRELRISTIKKLGTVPFACSFAPENDEFDEEIRQMIVGRYRVLFTIRGKRVHVLHLRGAYVGRNEETSPEQ